MAGYEAPDDIYFARSANAVNPVGRQGLELEDEQRLMIEADERLMIEADQVEREEAEEGGIFSNSTLAALKGAQAVAPKPKISAPSGPLVAYDSDSD